MSELQGAGQLAGLD